MVYIFILFGLHIIQAQGLHDTRLTIVDVPGA